jgi:Xaa-Pro aminopeptidase
LNAIIENRLSRLKKSLSERKIDTFMVSIEENRRYLSGFKGEDTQFDESAGTLFISDSDFILATDSRFVTQAEAEAPLYRVICCKEGLAKQLPDIAGALNTKRLGFESRRISYLQHKKITEEIETAGLSIELVDTEDVVEDFRILKQESEIEAIRDALSIAESVFEEFSGTISPGMTEKEAAWEFEKRMREAGADALSFPTIVASGPNSALPHAIPGERKIRKGEPILFDWGVKHNGYCSDISRTLIIGKPDETFKKVFTTVLDAQCKAIDAIGPGIGSKAVDDIARSHIEDMGFKDKFGHGLGHGVGLAIHEPPRLSPLVDKPLEAQMVFTVEPGIYIPGWGGVRLENMAVVRKDGAEILNRLDAGNFLAGG